ncbi:MAG: thioesterase [Oscillospiraceae bacterium]|nr:thioesterase [Oscillospiraceae bacterium]
MKWSEEYRVHYYYTDYNNILKPGYIARYMQETAWNALKNWGPAPEYFYKNNLAFILSKISFKYYEEIYEDDIIKVETWPLTPKILIFPRNYRIYKNNKIAVEAVSAWVLMDTKTKTVLRPDSFVNIFTNYDDEEFNFNVQRRFKMPDDMSDLSRYKVAYSDIDTNFHMNNAVYIDAVCNNLYADSDIISAEFKLKKKMISLDLNYNGEARFAQIIEINKGMVLCKDDETGINTEEYYMRAKIKETEQNCFEAKVVLEK